MRRSLAVICKPPDANKWSPDASGDQRTLTQRVYQTHTSPNAEHRTRPVLTVPAHREVCKTSTQRTHTTGRTLSVRCSQSETLYWSQATPDAWTGNTLRLVQCVRCSTLTEPSTDSTPDAKASVRCLRALRPVKHSRDFLKNSIDAIENMLFIFSKASNPVSQARRERERNLNSSQP